MDKILKDTLMLLGLSPKEVKFFETAFRLGSGGINDIAKEARLQRSTAYLIAEGLIKKGLIHEDYKNYRKTLVTVSPKTLLRMLSAKQRIVQRQELELEEHLSELDAFHRSTDIKPLVRVFNGTKALTTVWDDILSTNNEILLWTNQKTESLFFTKALHEKFIKERVRKKIPIRALAVHNVPGKKLLEKDELSFRQSKLLPINTTFRAETYIYDTKVAILDYEKDIIGIILESETISSSQRAIFEMTWNQC